jgi:hypothetical protein
LNFGLKQGNHKVARDMQGLVLFTLFATAAAFLKVGGTNRIISHAKSQRPNGAEIFQKHDPIREVLEFISQSWTVPNLTLSASIYIHLTDR